MCYGCSGSQENVLAVEWLRSLLTNLSYFMKSVAGLEALDLEPMAPGRVGRERDLDRARPAVGEQERRGDRDLLERVQRQHVHRLGRWGEHGLVEVTR